MFDYYAFQKFAVDACGHGMTVVGKPGVWSWDGLDPGTAALLEVAEVGPGDAVLDLGCGTGGIGVAAGLQAAQGRVTLVDCNVAAVACAEQTLAANDLADAHVRLADGVNGFSPDSFDLVLSHLPRGRAVQEELIRGAAWVLRPGGRFYFVAHKRSGVKGAIACALSLFGHCGVVRQRKGYHVALATKPDGLELPPPAESYVAHGVALDGVETTLVGKPGVFAWDRLDDGTAALIGAMEIGVADAVLDLGCGTGLAGLAAARRASDGHVVLVDADVRAVESARRTLAANGITGGEVLLSDCASTVSGRRFDVVIANPPFHQGVGVDYEVACQFVRDAARVLQPGGRLFLVANRFLRYGDLIAEVFGSVEAAYADNRYHVLTAVARKSALG
ncbi:MAG: methyltransferase [Anaerolineae bacterium]|nr:methyltransferase [Anaerolineae bacterium]